jgi:Holliday junction resolvase RusA-like endonuclease
MARDYFEFWVPGEVKVKKNASHFYARGKVAAGLRREAKEYETHIRNCARMEETVEEFEARPMFGKGPVAMAITAYYVDKARNKDVANIPECICDALQSWREGTTKVAATIPGVMYNNDSQIKELYIRIIVDPKSKEGALIRVWPLKGWRTDGKKGSGIIVPKSGIVAPGSAKAIKGVH